MATVTDLLTAALQDLAIVDATGVPTPEDLALAYNRVNDWLDDLKNDGLCIAQVLRTTWTLTPNVSSYTVGSTGTIAIDRPVGPQAITNIGFIDNSLTTPFERLLGPVLTEDQYAGVPFKSLTAPYPNAFYYSPTLPTGTLRPIPIPTAASLLGVIYAVSPLAEFTSLTQVLVLAPGYRRYVRNAVVVEIASAFEKQPPQGAIAAMNESRQKIKRVNERLQDVSFDAALTGGGRPSNVYTG